jgi:hypothetical protein
MTVQKDVQRAGLWLLMAESTLGVPDYSADPRVLERVGQVIGETASHDERHVRASDGFLRSTSREASPEQIDSGPSYWLLSVALSTSFCTLALLSVLAYWQFG